MVLLDYPKMAQKSLFEGQTENQAKPGKKPRRPLLPTSMKKPARYGASFYGKTIPPIFGPDGQLIACPCGRVHIMPSPEGDGAFLYDTQGELGKRQIALSRGMVPRFIEPNLARLKELLSKYGCNVHGTPAASAAVDKEEPKVKPWQK